MEPGAIHVGERERWGRRREWGKKARDGGGHELEVVGEREGQLFPRDWDRMCRWVDGKNREMVHDGRYWLGNVPASGVKASSRGGFSLVNRPSQSLLGLRYGGGG